jgi:tRNA pseudouridine13 synthase
MNGGGATACTLRPHQPALMTGDLPGLGGSVGPEPEDFAVDEIPLFEPEGSGEHLYVVLRKRCWTTPDAIRAVARAAGIRERDVGSAGLKDKHAVTTQWLSLPAAASPAEQWQLPAGLEVVRVSRGARKLRTGQQRGNRFRIRLSGTTDGALDDAFAIRTRLLERGLPNYFGAQRFGHGGENLGRAVSWLEAGTSFAGPRARFLRKLYPSVIQAEIFNRYLALRLELKTVRLLDGEVVRLDGSNALFVVADPERELPRLLARDIHPTGPMIGPKMKSAERAALELERRATDGIEIGNAARERLERLAPGTRRDLIVWPEQLEISPAEAGGLVLDFALPSGSYATQLIREFTHEGGGR